MAIPEIKSEDLTLKPEVHTVEEWFEAAIASGLSQISLATLATFVVMLNEVGGKYELISSHFLAMKDLNLAIHNPRPGVIQFLLSE